MTGRRMGSHGREALGSGGAPGAALLGGGLRVGDHGLEHGDVLEEAAPALGADAAQGLGALALETLPLLDEARWREVAGPLRLDQEKPLSDADAQIERSYCPTNTGLRLSTKARTASL